MRPTRRGQGEDQLAARRAALRVLLATASGDLRFDTALERELRRRPLGHPDRALARSIAAGCLKLRRRLDFILEQFVAKKHRPLPGAIQQILRIGVFQLTELSRVPRFASVNTSVELAKQWGHAGTAGLVNAVLRRVADHDDDWPWPERAVDPVLHLATVYSYPNWIIRHWLHENSEETAERYARLGNAPSGLTLRLVRGTEWPPALLAWFERHHVEVSAPRWFEEYRFLPEPPPIPELDMLASGETIVQNEAAAAAVRLLDLKPGETMVEVGAAPGGKASYAAMQTGPTGRVVAIDLNLRRLRRLRENIARTEQSWIVPVRADGEHLPVTGAQKILLDVPCSGLGLLHRHPDLRWQKDIADIARLAGLQMELLRAAFAALPPGGTLVYSTCTTTRDENEGLIARFLEGHTDATVIDPGTLLPAELVTSPHWVRIEPDPPELDGAFACAIRRMRPA